MLLGVRSSCKLGCRGCGPCVMATDSAFQNCKSPPVLLRGLLQLVKVLAVTVLVARSRLGRVAATESCAASRVPGAACASSNAEGVRLGSEESSTSGARILSDTWSQGHTTPDEASYNVGSSVLSNLLLP